MASYEPKCAECHWPSRRCECAGGFQEQASASVLPSRDMAYCLCGNLACGKPEWDVNGANPVCNYCRNQPWKNLSDAVGARYVGGRLRSGMIPNPWWWIGKAANDAAWHVVRCFGLYWVKMELPIAEPVPKMPKTITYRVGHDRPNLPTVAEIEPADTPQTASNWSKRASRSIHNG